MDRKIVGALLAFGALLVPLVVEPGPASVGLAPGSGVARPAPGVSAVREASLVSPPDTQYCETNFGIACYQPSQLQAAYDLSPLYAQGIDGSGETIVIVDPFGSPTISQDLHDFDRAFGLADPPGFRTIQPAGAVPPYPADPAGPQDRSAWASETTLDVEWSHALAPGAAILLVETPVPETEGVQGFPQIVAAENEVIDHHLGQVISQSFGATEPTFPSGAIPGLRSAFVNAARHGVTVLAGSGDQGATGLLADQSCCYTTTVVDWPGSDPLVTAVGGTQLSLNDAGNRTAADAVWNDTGLLGPGGGASGGGRSQLFGRPPYQDGVAGMVGDARGTPDISMSASVDGAVDTYSSFCNYSAIDPTTGTAPACGPAWSLGSGTSEATPEFAGIVALADQAAGHPLGLLNRALYRLAARGAPGIVDVTGGDNSY
ncbi:MAG TPA: S53 family peptidase, partial [Actinomycetota bacterium]|nr:S53 family peptidase [Actinomycetota bacterium]